MNISRNELCINLENHIKKVLIQVVGEMQGLFEIHKPDSSTHQSSTKCKSTVYCVFIILLILK